VTAFPPTAVWMASCTSATLMPVARGGLAVDSVVLDWAGRSPGRGPRSATPLIWPMMDTSGLPLSSRVLEVVAVDLTASSPFTPLTASSTLSEMGWEKFQPTPGIFSNSRSMAAIRSSLSCLKTGRHSPLGFEVDKVFVLKKPVVSVPSSGRPVWLYHLGHLGNALRRRRASFMTRRLSVGARGGRERANAPRWSPRRGEQELRADRAAECQIACEDERERREPDGSQAMLDRPTSRCKVR